MAASLNYNSPELKVFKLHFSKLAESVSHPEWLANELYSRDVISKAVRDEALHIMGPSPYYRASKLVAAVEDQIVANPSVLSKFLLVMRKDRSLVYIADSMSDHYHRSLFPPISSNTSVPTLTQLSTELKDLENWYLLGLQLNIGKDTLDSIEGSHDNDVRRCIEMVQYWIKNSENLSWGAIHEALRNIGESVLAAKIAEKYHIQSSTISKENCISLSKRSAAYVPKLEQSIIGEGKSTTATMKKELITIEERWRICSYFATVLDEIKNILKKYIKPKDLVGFLRLHCHPLYPEKLYVDPNILQHVKSVSKVMESLVPDYINYMETGLLEAIIERFKCKKAQTLLQQYHDRYPYLRQLKDMPNPIPDERLDQTSRQMLRAKCEGHFDNARAVDVKRIQTSIESATGIDHRFVTPAQHSEGSFILTFLIPESVSGIFHELCDEDLELLAIAGIVELKIDDFVINDIQEYCRASSAQDSSSSIAGQSGAVPKGFDTYIEEGAEQFTSREKAQLNDLLKNIPQSTLKDVCTNSFLQQLSTHMTDWRKLAPYLGISELSAKELAYRHPDVSEQRYRALLCWKQISPETAIYRNLIACFLTHAPFDLANSLLKMLTPDAAVKEIRILLQEAYLSEKSQPLWTGAPELLQFNRGLYQVTEDTDKQYKDIDYSFQFETLEHFSFEVETVSIKSFVNEVAKKEHRFFLIKGPPGSGRTALLRRVCAFWARGFCLRKFTLVLCLNLKAHPSAPSGDFLRTLLSHVLPQGTPLGSIRQWLKQCARDVLIVVDGVDGQGYDKWVDFLGKMLLKDSSFIFTAANPIQIKNPVVSPGHLDLCQYDLLGLSQDQIIRQVIYHCVDNTSRAERFLMYISEVHDIRALCSSPPHLASVLFVFDNVDTRDLPNTSTQLFTSLEHSLLNMSGCDTFDVIAILEAYARRHTKLTMEWQQYTTFCSKVTPPYHTVADQCSFKVPLLQQYLYAQYIHSLPHDQHVLALRDKAVPLHVRQFYVGLCGSTAACISEVSAERLQSLQVLTSSQLLFEEQCFSPIEIHCIFQAIHNSKQLCKLEFYNCSFGCLTFEMMAKWLRANQCSDSTVQELTLWYMALDKEASYALAGALKVNHILQVLNLGWNKIPNGAVYALAKALQVNQGLHSLNLSYNHITDEGACALAKALQVNHSLQELNLWNNEIADKGTCALAEALQVNQILQTLSAATTLERLLFKSGINFVGKLADSNDSRISLWENKISDKGACRLATALQVNKSLQNLNLHWNHILEHGKTVLSEAMQKHKTLKIEGLDDQWQDQGHIPCDQHQSNIIELLEDPLELLLKILRYPPAQSLRYSLQQSLRDTLEQMQRDALEQIQRHPPAETLSLSYPPGELLSLEQSLKILSDSLEQSLKILRYPPAQSLRYPPAQSLRDALEQIQRHPPAETLSLSLEQSLKILSLEQSLKILSLEQSLKILSDSLEQSLKILRYPPAQSLRDALEQIQSDYLAWTLRLIRDALEQMQRYPPAQSLRDAQEQIQRAALEQIQRDAQEQMQRAALEQIQRDTLEQMQRAALEQIQRDTLEQMQRHPPAETLSLSDCTCRYSVHRSSSISFHAQRRSLKKVKLKRKNPKKRGLDLKSRPWQQ